MRIPFEHLLFFVFFGPAFAMSKSVGVENVSHDKFHRNFSVTGFWTPQYIAAATV